MRAHIDYVSFVHSVPGTLYQWYLYYRYSIRDTKHVLLTSHHHQATQDRTTPPFQIVKGESVQGE
jgi:hypothetical protein